MIKNLERSEFVTLIFNVPVKDADRLREVMGKAGAGKFENYAFCSFSSQGVGRFMPCKNAQPHIGELNKLEMVQEEKIETICHQDYLEAVITAIKEAHPYETMAIDIIPVYEIGLKMKK